MPYLSWIDDSDLQSTVTSLLATSRAAVIKAKTDFYSNVIDPFSAIFQMAGFPMTSAEWIKSEEARQAQKTLQNHVGEFHQSILGKVNGWKNLGTGHIVDLVSTQNQIIAEVKNKHNTVTGGSLKDLYETLEGQVMPKSSIYKGYIAYYVTIIPKRPTKFDIEFTPSDKSSGTKKPVNKLIRHTDGASFYALVTGQGDALEELFKVLPSVINDVLRKKQISPQDVTFLNQLFDRAYN